MSRLLVTTFQKDGHNLREAQLFKKEALRSKLVTRDRVSELWPLPLDLKHTKDLPGILEVGSTDDERLFGFLQLSMAKGAGWKRLTKNHRPLFESLLAKLYSELIDCWVIGGHHHSAPDTYTAMAWGTEFKRDGFYRPYVGFGVDKDTSQLEWFGFREDASIPRDIALPGATPSLKHVSLMLVLGCNGIPRTYGGNVVFNGMAQAWRKLTKPALILGWFGVHGMPLDSLKRNASGFFWQGMEALKGKHSIPDGGLRTLVANHPNDVVQAWGEACHKAFSTSQQRDLWRAKVPGLLVADVRGAGAVLPDGKVFHANSEYVLGGAKPAMVYAGVVVP